MYESLCETGLLTTFQSAIRLENVSKTTWVKAPINVSLKRDMEKKKNFKSSIITVNDLI